MSGQTSTIMVTFPEVPVGITTAPALLTSTAVVPANESPAAAVLVSISPASRMGMVVPWGMVTVLGATGQLCCKVPVAA